jgi:PhoH-like ATPase
MKTYILDTNVLLHDPKSLFAFEDNEVILPLVVLDELDKKKEGLGESARNAREVIRALDELRVSGNISVGIKTKGGGTIKIELGHKDKIPADLDPSRADNRIVSAAIGLSGAGSSVVVVTKDINLRVKCDALGIKTEDYNNDQAANNVDEIYSGFKEIEVPGALVDEFNTNRCLAVPDGLTLYVNQYVFLKANDRTKCSSLSKFNGQSLVPIKYYSNIWGINPRNREQTCALDALYDEQVKLVTLIGKSGCGKTLLTLASGLNQLLETHKYKKIIVTKPNIPISKQLSLGFLPGDLNDKMDPWLGGVWDNLDFLFGGKGKSIIEQYKDEGIIEVAALENIRGRSYNGGILVICDEAQNLSKHEIKSLVTRVGEDSKIILTGDINQVDNIYLDALNNGLSNLIEAFKPYGIAAHVTFTKGERSELATLASQIL